MRLTLLNLNPFDNSPPLQFDLIGPVTLPTIPNLTYPSVAQQQEGGGEVVDANKISMVKGGSH